MSGDNILNPVVYFNFLILSLLLFVNMGEGERRCNGPDEPRFVALEEGAGSFRATIFDEKSQTKVKDLSFFGHTSVGGIRKERDDSFNELELSKLKKIEVVKVNYQSKRYSDREFILVYVVTSKGKKIKDLLIPKKIVICGIEEDSGIQKAWFISKLDKIEVKGPREMTKEKKKKIEKELSVVQPKVEKKVTISSAILNVVDSFIELIKAFFGGITRLFS